MAPGRSVYSNFGFFLQTFRPPAGASVVELRIYLELLRRFDEEGVLKDGAYNQHEKTFRGVIEAKGDS